MPRNPGRKDKDMRNPGTRQQSDNKQDAGRRMMERMIRKPAEKRAMKNTMSEISKRVRKQRRAGG